MKTSSLLQLSSAACLLSVGATASAAVQCSPTAFVSADIVSLQGNCIDTITNLALVAGSEVWRVQAGSGSNPVGQRTLPGGSLNVPLLPGEHTYFITSIDTGYGGPIDVGGEGYPSVTVLGAGAPASSQATLNQASAPLLALQTGRLQSNLANAQARMRILRGKRALAQFDVQGLPLPTQKKEQGDTSQAGRFGVYLLGLGDYLRQSGSAAQPEFKLRTVSLSMGADLHLGDEWAVGGNVGPSDSRVSFDGSPSKQTSKGRQATAYASWNVSPATYVSATLSYEATRFNLVRDDGAGGAALSSPRGHGVGISLSAGRDFSVGAWSIGPYVRWDHITSSVDGFDEMGSDSAVSMSAQRLRSRALNIGAQTQLSVPVSWGVLLPYVRLELTRRSEALQQSPTATLLNGSTPLLVPTAADTTGSHGSVAAGLSGLHQGGVSWFADYETGVAQKGYRSERIGLGLRFEL